MVLETECLTNLDSLLDVYSIQAKTAGLSPNTIRIYGTALKVFKSFLEFKNYSTDVSRISPTHIREFIGYLQNVNAFIDHPFTRPQAKGLTGHTINCYLRAIRAFWTWLLIEEIIEENPFDRIRIPKAPKKVITPFSNDQIYALLAVIDTKTDIGFRDWTIILTLLDTGVRVSELTGLKIEHVNLAQRSFKVHGKGNKERLVPIGISVQRALSKYMSKHRKPSVLSDNLFLNRNGMPITANRVESIMGQYAEKAGIKGVRPSPHTLRHTFAVSYLRNGGDVFSLQRILGHETLEMVRNYVCLAQSDIQEAHLRCSPVDRLGIRRRTAGARVFKLQ